MAKELKLKTTTEINRNISDESLQTAAEMFTYLITCLPNQKLFGFITHLFLNKTPKEIILALIGIIKTSQNSERTVEIFSNAMKSLRLNQYEEIQIITKGKCYTNGIIGNCTRKANITEEEDLQMLSGFLHKVNNHIYNFHNCRIQNASEDDKSSCSYF